MHGPMNVKFSQVKFLALLLLHSSTCSDASVSSTCIWRRVSRSWLLQCSWDEMSRPAC
jgi:hypothetical protein